MLKQSPPDLGRKSVFIPLALFLVVVVVVVVVVTMVAAAAVVVIGVDRSLLMLGVLTTKIMMSFVRPSSFTFISEIRRPCL